MDRTEASGFGVAVAGHAALLLAVSLSVTIPRRAAPKTEPIEVSFVDEVALDSASPTPAAEAPAPLQAPTEGPPEPAAMPAPPQVQPVAAPPQSAVRTPAPAPTPEPKAPARPAPPITPAVRAVPPPRPPATNPTGRLKGLLNGVSDRASESRTTQVPAASAGPAVQASLGAEVKRQLKPHWKAPTGADSEQLRTEVVITLAQDGRATAIRIVGTTGQTASNRPQVQLHQEQAERAVRLASPFRLPAEYYSAWKQIRVTFDKRLSQ